MENFSSKETLAGGVRGRGGGGGVSWSPANRVPSCCLLSEGDAGRVHELLRWRERVHRYRRLLYCDDETCLETLTERQCGKRAHAPSSDTRARATFDHEVFPSFRIISHLPHCFSLVLYVAWFKCMRPANVRKKDRKHSQDKWKDWHSRTMQDTAWGLRDDSSVTVSCRLVVFFWKKNSVQTAMVFWRFLTPSHFPHALSIQTRGLFQNLRFAYRPLQKRQGGLALCNTSFSFPQNKAKKATRLALCSEPPVGCAGLWPSV